MLTTLPFNLKIKGTYHELGNFISKVESSRDVLKISRFNLSQSASAKAWGRVEEEGLIANVVIDAVFLAE